MNPLKILIVENEILIAKQLSNYLKKQKYEIAGISRTGEQALELAKYENPDVILMDIDLDGEMDGIQAAASIHQSLIIPIVYLSQIVDSQTLKRASATYPATYLTKPYKNLDVRNAIEMAISSLSLLTNKHKKDVNISLDVNLKMPQKLYNVLHSIQDKIFIKKDNGSFDRLKFDEIVYIRTDDHTLIIETIFGEMKTNYTLAQFLEFFQAYPIFRIHKQYAINSNYVCSISKTELKLEYTNGFAEVIQQTFKIGPSYQKEVLKNFTFLTPKKDK